MPIPIRQLTAAYAARYSNNYHASHHDLSGGMVRDIISYLAPDGSVYDAIDMLCDKPGAIRKRGGITSPSSSNRAAVVENLVGYASRGVDGVTGIFGSLGKAGAQIIAIDKTTGAPTTVLTAGSAAVFACRPFQHENIMVFPFQALGTTVNDRNKVYFGGGSSIAGTSGTNAIATAGGNVVTGLAGMTAGMVGQIFSQNGSAGPGEAYAGRIVAFISATSVRVEPAPVYSFGVANNWLTSPAFDPNSSSPPFANGHPVVGRYGVSFQGRMVFGYTLQTYDGSTLSVTGLEVNPNRIAWSQLATELLTGGTYYDGNRLLYPEAFDGRPNMQYFNFVDVPNLGGMTGLGLVGEGQLMIFGPRSIFRLSGLLTTETEENNEVQFSVDQVSNNVGCIAAKSIQYSQGGLIWAGNDNIYQYDGSTLKPLLQGRDSHYYQDRLRAGDRPVGSAYALNRNHYYLSMNGSDTSGLMINLETGAVTRFTNVQLFDSTPDPADATKLWGALWWDTTAAAPTMVKGQLVGLESIWLPAAANSSDANGNAVLSSVTTKAYMDGTLESQKLYRELHVDFDLRAAGSSPTATVTADTQLDPADATFTTLTQGTLNKSTLPQVAHMDITNQLREGKALEAKIVLNAAADTFEIRGVNIAHEERPLT